MTNTIASLQKRFCDLFLRYFNSNSSHSSRSKYSPQRVSIKKVETAKQNILDMKACGLTQQELDAFRMKTISMLRQNPTSDLNIQDLDKFPILSRILSATDQASCLELSQYVETPYNKIQLQGHLIRYPDYGYRFINFQTTVGSRCC